MRILLIIFSILLTSGCGFKIVNQSSLDNYNIANITTSGDARIAYKLKNIISSYASEQSDKVIDIDFKIKKNKSVKEKNDKNEITKYQIVISIDTTVEKIVDNKTIKFNITNSGEFRVASKNSQSIINEKKLISLLTENISSEIAEEIIKKIDDI
ncbi:hypothetical protein OAM06_00410 [Pelagibacteraceae bacterium]|mgnify:FL=1|jgi:outer membrane lipopolysaccharide assembly protein LptE/RlpB|nr:hypothetical protein [Pelagibacteraceae bacterium]|tara:strand:- start:1563 stop:2027 length:465 start_codon:yes stop_codon:yes gene_type:complete